MLLKAREQVKHGQWKKWIKENTNLSYRTASRWIAEYEDARRSLSIYDDDWSELEKVRSHQLLDIETDEDEEDEDDAPSEPKGAMVAPFTPLEVAPAIHAKIEMKTPDAVKKLPEGKPQPKPQTSDEEKIVKEDVADNDQESNEDLDIETEMEIFQEFFKLFCE